MNELLSKFIGKRCIITRMNSEVIIATITEVKDNWVAVESDTNGLDMINADYITRIYEYPQKAKKNKKKTSEE